MNDDKLSAEAKEEILRVARARYQRAMDRERANILAAYDDLEFLAGLQWPRELEQQRRDDGRPVLTINQLPQFVHQVTGDIRQMRPAIKVVPVDDEADPKMAEVRGGMIRYIENRSDSSGVYFRAADSQVAAGIGHWRVLTEYAEETTFQQEIRIRLVDDGISVLWDPDAKDLTKEDAQFCFVPVDFTHDAFKEKYPDANMAELESVRAWQYYSEWHNDDTIRVSEYWVREPKDIVLGLTHDGQTINLSDEDDGLDIEEKKRVIVQMGGRVEVRRSYEIVRYLITATDVLERQEWMGRFIPIVPVIGEEIRIGKRTVRRGIVRDAKDAQRMYNYFRSAESETIALQPKAPFMVTERNVAKYQDVWETANKNNWPYLPYEPDSLNGGAAPQRVAPPVSSQGISESVAQANEDLRRIIGIYDASLGARSNETSGKAIQARQREGDVGTYVYIDNFTRAVRHTGKILIDLIPHVYDTDRTIRIMGEDGRLDRLKINQSTDEAGLPILDERGNPVVMNDISVGAYDVVAEVGPSYTTKREEAKDGMLEFVKMVPNAGAVIGDLVAKAQDWPMADKIGTRLRAMLPPQLLQVEQMEEQGLSADEITQALLQMQEGQQPPPDPKVMAVQAKAELDQQKLVFDQNKFIAELQQKNDQLRAELEKAAMASRTSVEVAQINAGVGMHKNIIDAATAQYGKDIDAAVEQQQIETRANVDRDKAFVAAETARYATDRRPEPRAGQ